MTSSGKPRAIVTGSQGFIGRHLWKALKSDGWMVIGYDIESGEDILDPHFTPYSYSDVDQVFHLAAQTNAQAGGAYDDAMTNILGTISVLERFRDKVVFASSCAINYPVTPYAISKLAGEYYARLFGARIVRLCNIYGPGGHGVFEKFAAADRIQIAGTGVQLRTYAPVAHAVSALLYSTEPLCVLWGEDLTVNQVADRVAADKPREYVPQSVNDLMIGVQVYDEPR